MQNKETKKILYVITKSNWGGAQRYVYDLATEITKKGYEVSVALGGDGVLKDRLTKQNIPVISLTSLQRDVKIGSDIKVFFELLSLFRKEKPDVIHLNSSKVGIIGALAGRLYGCKKIIFTAHGWAHTEQRPLYQKKIIKLLHWLTVLFSHTTIPVSEKTKREISNMPWVQKKLTVIYNGINTPNFYDKQTARKELSPTLSSDALTIGTIAELHLNKGLTYLIESFTELLKDNDIYLVLIGSGEKKQELHNLVKQKNIEEHVIFFESSSANRYLKAFDIFILPSIKEGLPYTILEAGLAKLPVVASRVGGIPEIITHKKTGLLTQPRNVHDIQKKLGFLTHNKQERSTLGTNLFNHVQENFSTQNMVRKTLACYLSCNE